jgi:hypothetical protein
MFERDAAVIIGVRLEDDELGTDADDQFVETLERAIKEGLTSSPEIGYWDGHEFGSGWATIFCYGKDGALLSDCVLGAILPFHASRQLCVTNDGLGTEDDFMLLLSRPTAAESTSH